MYLAMLWSLSLMSSGIDKWKRVSSFWKLLTSSMTVEGSSDVRDANFLVQLMLLVLIKNSEQGTGLTFECGG